MTRKQPVPSRSQKRRPEPSPNGDDEGTLAAAVARALLARNQPAALTPTVPPRPPRTLTIGVPPGVTPERANARTRLRGLAYNAVLIEEFSGPLFADGLTDTLNDTVAALEETVAAVQRGELGNAEALLMAQAVTLNTIFARCAGTAAQNLEGQHLEGTERYLRLALKAQSQCRTTIETLAILKNPTTIFARQANIAQGPQQVNNTQVNTVTSDADTSTTMHAAAATRHTEPCGNVSRARGKIWAKKTITVRVWTPAQRARQAAAIQRWRPWEQATGPRTPEGKARVARNADRGGQRQRERTLMQSLHVSLRWQSDVISGLARVVIDGEFLTDVTSAGQSRTWIPATSKSSGPCIDRTI